MPAASSIFAKAAEIGAGVTCRQMALLFAVADESGHTNKVYTHKFNWPAPSVTRAIDALETLGLLSRRTSDADRRKTVVTVTPAGARMVRALSHAAEG
jgi:DNA-binding MarR family transcriptional regulator